MSDFTCHSHVLLEVPGLELRRLHQDHSGLWVSRELSLHNHIRGQVHHSCKSEQLLLHIRL